MAWSPDANATDRPTLILRRLGRLAHDHLNHSCPVLVDFAPHATPIAPRAPYVSARGAPPRTARSLCVSVCTNREGLFDVRVVRRPGSWPCPSRTTRSRARAASLSAKNLHRARDGASLSLSRRRSHVDFAKARHFAASFRESGEKTRFRRKKERRWKKTESMYSYW